jgi:hypothetical protein
MGAWREAEDQDSRLRVAERRHGPAPVFLVTIGAPFGGSDGGAMFAKTRAAFAPGDFLLQKIEQSETVLFTWYKVVPINRN